MIGPLLSFTMQIWMMQLLMHSGVWRTFLIIKLYDQITQQVSISQSSQTKNYYCTGDNISFTLINMPTNIASINWTSDGGLSINGSSTGTSCTFTVNTSGTAYQKVYATITSTYGNSVTIPFQTGWLNTPQATSVSGPSPVRFNSTYSYYANANYTNGTNYSWWTSPSTSQIWPYSGTNMADISFNNTGTYYVMVRASNSCGQTTPVGKLVTVNATGSMLLSPNPAANEVTVTISDNPVINAESPTSSTLLISTASSTAESTYNVTVTDIAGEVLYKTKKHGNKFTLPTQNLSNGVYFITADDGITRYSSQLVINH